MWILKILCLNHNYCSLLIKNVKYYPIINKISNTTVHFMKIMADLSFRLKNKHITNISLIRILLISIFPTNDDLKKFMNRNFEDLKTEFSNPDLDKSIISHELLKEFIDKDFSFVLIEMISKNTGEPKNIKKNIYIIQCLIILTVNNKFMDVLSRMNKSYENLYNRLILMKTYFRNNHYLPIYIANIKILFNRILTYQKIKNIHFYDLNFRSSMIFPLSDNKGKLSLYIFYNI